METVALVLLGLLLLTIVGFSVVLFRTKTRLQHTAAVQLAQHQQAAAHQAELGQQRLDNQTRVLVADKEALAADRARFHEEKAQLAQRSEVVVAQLQQIREKSEQLAAKNADFQREKQQWQSHCEAAQTAQQRELVRISGLTATQARQELLAAQETEIRHDTALLVRRIEAEARATADAKARAIVADSISRVASEQTTQSVVSVIQLPADDLKGRIIGREGRNIRAFENITGVNVIIDDTPEAVLLSCFEPVRREIARVTLQALIDDGRIHPHSIEEAYEKACQQVEQLCARAAEDALLEVGISDLHPELARLVGQLKYRTSYGQNVLAHMIETSHIARMMAAELAIDPQLASRGAFLHDIGKALTHEANGSHALVGAELARKYGESEEVAHCIEAHHDEVTPSTVAAVLTQAADACSGGRPGARRESLESYVKRLESIEAIALAKTGVDKVFAMQAGREVRVMVKPEVVDDMAAQLMAREVAKQIEEELTYPGQVRVTVIRETRATETAR